MKKRVDINNFDYDYVIIGSGFGGSVAALRLSEKGYKVLVIEKGRWYSGDDFPKTNWNLKKWLWLPGIRFFGFFKLTILRRVSIISGVGVGGGSLVYANTLPRPKREFFNSGNWKGIADWETELEPYYQEAERMLGVTKNPGLFASDLALKQVAAMNGKSHEFEPTRVSIFFGDGTGKNREEVPDPYFNGQGPPRGACIYCGQCMTGCRHNAKNSLDKNYLWFAQKRGATILAERKVSMVRPLNGENGEEGYEIGFRPSGSPWFGKTVKIKSRGVVFAGGVLGTVRLMLNLKKNNMLPNLSDIVGDNIRTNNESLVFVVSKNKDAEFSKGIAIGSIFPPDENGHLEAVRYGEGSGFWRLLSIPYVFNNHFWSRVMMLVKTLVLHPCDWFRVYFTKNYSSKTMILLFMQHLDSTLKFSRGWGHLRSSVSKGKSPTPFMPLAKKLASDTGKVINGNQYVFLTDVLAGTPSTAHILGGAVIGKDSKRGVIDKHHRVFGYRNMYVCDGSAISANPGVNPSLTITAMSERAMARIPRKAN